MDDKWKGLSLVVGSFNSEDCDSNNKKDNDCRYNYWMYENT